MTVLRVEVEENADLETLQDVLDQLGYQYSVEGVDDITNALPDAAIEGIEAGLRDAEEGRVFSQEDAIKRIALKIHQLRTRHGA